jgi:DNA-binding transcriptional ArsR family regulator
MAMSKKEKNDAILGALGHPVRRKILRYLENVNGSGASPSEMADELGEKLPNVSYHVRILAKTGALKLVKTTPRRGAIEHHYSRAGNAVDKGVTKVLELIGKD